tara:strand:+ start:87 stop:539 length:453 start_codon:yes stop_codon:yes gene_type:complete
MAEEIYTCLGCLAKIPATDLDCPKCGRRTAAGKKFDLDKKWNSPEKKAAAKREAQSFNAVLVLFPVVVIAMVAGGIAIVNDVKNTPKSKEQILMGKLRVCDSYIKNNLKDPSSYKRINSDYIRMETGFIRYSATNSFGARVQEVYKCFDP